VAAYRHAGGVGGIGAVALADLLGHWPAADGPLYRLLATRIARLADTRRTVRGSCGCHPNATWPPSCP